MTDSPEEGWPLTLTRRMVDFPIGNVPLHEWLVSADEELRELLENCKYPWDLLELNERIIGKMSADELLGDVHSSAVIEGNISLGKGSRILPGVFIEGNVVIGENCKIGPNCYVRGNSSIGNSCHIGQAVEIKNCIILDGTNVGHLSYVGDSILGEKVNFGAGTIVSNLRHDGSNHRSNVGGELLDTGRRKLGTIVGDGVHTGIGTMIYPGRKIWPGMSTRPGEIVERDLLPGK
jgi:bifunctional UDP-N-acetylglucosamine pyrophosphorylase/glucosamine-1-phosphate N-acetyltransferase